MIYFNTLKKFKEQLAAKNNTQKPEKDFLFTLATFEKFFAPVCKKTEFW